MKYVITDSGNIMVVVRGYTYSVSTSHPKYNNILKTLQAPKVNEATLIEYLEFKEACEEFGISINERGVHVDGKLDEHGEEAMEEGVSLGNIALRKALEGL